MSNDVKLEQAVAVCPQCEGDHTECTRCAGNGWIVDLTSLYRHQPQREAALRQALAPYGCDEGTINAMVEDVLAALTTPAPAVSTERHSTPAEQERAVEIGRRLDAEEAPAVSTDEIVAVLERCSKIVDRNLYRQSEKVEDVPVLLRRLAARLKGEA